MKKSLIVAAVLSLTVSPLAVSAQEVPEVVQSALQVGATVYGPEGAVVGTIEEMPSGNVVVFTGKNRATLPQSAFGMNETGLLVSMTKEQLDAAVEAAEAKASAAMSAALQPDAQVYSRDGAMVGKVQKIEGENVVVELPEGTAITLQKEHLNVDQTGLKLFMTAAEFQAAVNAATTASPDSAAATEADAGA